MNDEARQLAVRLAETFEVVPYELTPQFTFEGAAEWLGIVPEDVRVLVQTGLLPGRTDRGGEVALVDLVRFVDRTDWLRLRAARVQAHLETTLEELDEPATAQL
jgi:hypothetical protein